MIATVSSGAVVAVLLLGWGISTMGFFSSNVSDSQTAAAAGSDTNLVQQIQNTAASYSAQLQGQKPVTTGVTDTGAVVTIPASQ